VNVKKKDSLKKYCDAAKQGGVTDAAVISPESVVTAPWVRLKCQFGCGGYDNGYCCPPHTPTCEETRKILDAYRRAILFHIEAPASRTREKKLRDARRMLLDLEDEIFRDGYYKAFVFLAGPCDLCKTCGKISGNPCYNGYRARPSMEACGIDVFQTARNNGFVIETLRSETETRNVFCLMLVD
jgi:predicted metal-binding protein